MPAPPNSAPLNLGNGVSVRTDRDGDGDVDVFSGGDFRLCLTRANMGALLAWWNGDGKAAEPPGDAAAETTAIFNGDRVKATKDTWFRLADNNNGEEVWLRPADVRALYEAAK